MNGPKLQWNHFLPCAATIVLGTMLLGGCVFCAMADPMLVNKALVGDHFFIGFKPETTGWISVERSSDLSAWTSIGSVATTNNVAELFALLKQAQQSGCWR